MKITDMRFRIYSVYNITLGILFVFAFWMNGMAQSNDINVFELENYDQSITYYGVDCSLFKIRSDQNLAQDESIKANLLLGIPYQKRNFTNPKTLKSWLKLSHEVIDKYEFGANLTESNMPEIWIIPGLEIYHISRKEIQNYISKLEVSGVGLGLIQIPELTDMHSHHHYGWVVFFDMDSKDVVWMNRYMVDQHLNEWPRHGHFATEFVLVMKSFITQSKDN